MQQIQSKLIKCPPPRKSLVKGERFIRSEGRPECNDFPTSLLALYTATRSKPIMGFVQLISQNVIKENE